MNDEAKSRKTQITVAVIGVVGVLGAAFLATLDKLRTPGTSNPIPTTTVEPVSVDPVVEMRVSKMRLEITHRLQEIRNFLYHDQMTNRSLYNGTQRLTAHGVGISAEFKNTELRTLLFELSNLVSENERLPIENMLTLFDELAAIGPHAPFADADRADPDKVTSARNKFIQIERAWQRF